jgi:hypothetical protein
MLPPFSFSQLLHYLITDLSVLSLGVPFCASGDSPCCSRQPSSHFCLTFQSRCDVPIHISDVRTGAHIPAVFPFNPPPRRRCSNLQGDRPNEGSRLETQFMHALSATSHGTVSIETGKLIDEEERIRKEAVLSH